MGSVWKYQKLALRLPSIAIPERGILWRLMHPCSVQSRKWRWCQLLWIGMPRRGWQVRQSDCIDLVSRIVYRTGEVNYCLCEILIFSLGVMLGHVDLPFLQQAIARRLLTAGRTEDSVPLFDPVRHVDRCIRKTIRKNWRKYKEQDLWGTSNYWKLYCTL